MSLSPINSPSTPEGEPLNSKQKVIDSLSKLVDSFLSPSFDAESKQMSKDNFRHQAQEMLTNYQTFKEQSAGKVDTKSIFRNIGLIKGPNQKKEEVLEELIQKYNIILTKSAGSNSAGVDEEMKEGPEIFSPTLSDALNLLKSLKTDENIIIEVEGNWIKEVSRALIPIIAESVIHEVVQKNYNRSAQPLNQLNQLKEQIIEKLDKEKDLKPLGDIKSQCLKNSEKSVYDDNVKESINTKINIFINEIANNFNSQNSA